ncbi:hypothetical protein BHM03_00019456 [Ensete ventricosum]|uniref:Uncharacterized protein n=1 Tax=Ensete ventricosum TaxID=4639 RepID=A0A445MFK5_ENSVE|nr:hypothetical protein BHM03_00019456 [Ensete ventricosum]
MGVVLKKKADVIRAGPATTWAASYDWRRRVALKPRPSVPHVGPPFTWPVGPFIPIRAQTARTRRAAAVLFDAGVSSCETLTTHVLTWLIAIGWQSRKRPVIGFGKRPKIYLVLPRSRWHATNARTHARTKRIW